MAIKWMFAAQRRQIGRELIDCLKGQGIFFELNEAGDGFDVTSYTSDSAGGYVPIPPTALEEIAEKKAFVLLELQKQEETNDRWKWLLIEHNPQWREEFGHLLETTGPQ